MREIDRAMIEDYRVDLLQMMEIAGRNLARLAKLRFFGLQPLGRKVVVLAGAGANGGGALVCARHLFNWGCQVEVYLAKNPEQFAPVPAHQLDILVRMSVAALDAEKIPSQESADLIIDGLVGYGLTGPPRGKVADLIRWANTHAAPVLALDIPSGVDATTGQVPGEAIRAAVTMTLAIPKTGFRERGARDLTGELYLADIGVPAELLAKMNIGIPGDRLFTKSELYPIDLHRGK
jgi:NAD(P)H-hydrate epimerase